jgi:uncharacterized protein with FMN-binding domain
MNDSTGPNKALVSVIVIILVGLVVGGGYLLTRPSDESDINTSVQNESLGDATTSTSSGTYVNGVYDATGSYNSPGGRESIKVSLTITDGKVTDSTVISNAKNATAKNYQADFIASYKSEVVGKSIDEIKLDTVAGSSLTPAGFENALEQIKQDAAA